MRALVLISLSLLLISQIAFAAQLPTIKIVAPCQNTNSCDIPYNSSFNISATCYGNNVSVCGISRPSQGLLYLVQACNALVCYANTTATYSDIGQYYFYATEIFANQTQLHSTNNVTIIIRNQSAPTTTTTSSSSTTTTTVPSSYLTTTFTETGLPTNVTWAYFNITYGTQTKTTTESTLSFSTPSGAYPMNVNNPHIRLSNTINAYYPANVTMLSVNAGSNMAVKFGSELCVSIITEDNVPCPTNTTTSSSSTTSSTTSTSTTTTYSTTPTTVPSTTSTSSTTSIQQTSSSSTVPPSSSTAAPTNSTTTVSASTNPIIQTIDTIISDIIGFFKSL